MHDDNFLSRHHELARSAGRGMKTYPPQLPLLVLGDPSRDAMLQFNEILLSRRFVEPHGIELDVVGLIRFSESGSDSRRQ